ncbi:MAG: alpha/beta hydrolase-fold protein [bacterium]
MRSAVRSALFVLLLAASPAAAQSLRVRADGRRELSIKSAVLGATRSLYLAPPLGDKNRTATAVLVLLDADDEVQFNAAIANIRFLEDRGAIPPLLIVGVPNGATRNTDLAPAAGMGATASDPRSRDGTDRFARFLESEALPAVRAHYPTLPYTVIAGHSLGALFVLQVLATRPGPYAAAIAMSPSLWWSNGALGAPFAEAIKPLRAPFRLFVSSGAYEPRIDVPTQQFVASLRAGLSTGSLEFRSRHYPEDSHALTPLSSLTDGLRFVFEPTSLAVSTINLLDGNSDSASVVAAFFGVAHRYAAGARTIGLDTLVPESFALRSGASALVNLRKPRAAGVILDWVVRAYPRSVAARDTYADALVAAGELPAARAEYARAIALAKASGDSSVSVIRAKQQAIPVSPPSLR